MSLASYFLVLVEQTEKSVRAGLQYFFIAHAGSVLIMIAFSCFTVLPAHSIFQISPI
ncbi:hypothetical protein P4S72_02680 [Vibrio sp. PP-XX7]